MSFKRATYRKRFSGQIAIASDEETLQQVLEAEMDEALQASKGERTAGRLGYQAGYYNRMLVTRVGHIELRVPQDRQVREDGAVRSQAVLIAIGINWEGRRNILAVELASRESVSSWKELPASLRQWPLHGVEFVVSELPRRENLSFTRYSESNGSGETLNHVSDRPLWHISSRLQHSAQYSR